MRFGPVAHTGSVLDPFGVRLGVFSHTGLLNPEEIGFSGTVPKNNFRRMRGLELDERSRAGGEGKRRGGRPRGCPGWTPAGDRRG